MADKVYRNVPYGNGTITIKDEWPQKIKDMWLAALGPYTPEPPPFVPQFEPQAFSESPNSPPMPMNIEDYATQETADELGRRFGATVVSIGLPYSTARQLWLQWPDGTGEIAGRLAAFYVNNPEDKFPHYAENLCWRAIAANRIMGIHVPVSVEPMSGMKV